MELLNNLRFKTHPREMTKSLILSQIYGDCYHITEKISLKMSTSLDLNEPNFWFDVQADRIERLLRYSHRRRTNQIIFH